jgi:pimeloyl-ACP methyl ester carboxylesterase
MVTVGRSTSVVKSVGRWRTSCSAHSGPAHIGSWDGPHVIFIHGMYLNGQSFQPWVERFAAAGFSGSAPSWPYHHGDPATLRSVVSPDLGALTLGALTGHFKALIDALAERPNLVGHSIGALLVQRLVNDGYARAGISISSAPPQGMVSFSPHFLRANFPHINPLARNRPVFMTQGRFHYAFCNTLTRSASDAAFDRFVVPESRNVPGALSGGRPGSTSAPPKRPCGFSPAPGITSRPWPWCGAMPIGTRPALVRWTTRSSTAARTTSAASGAGKRSQTPPSAGFGTSCPLASFALRVQVRSRGQ